jgi:3-oxoacyl-[acyl-carrier-protein] synthase III
MRFQKVCIESLGYVLPTEVLTSDALEQRLEPLYDRLRLPAGRLEMMTGIRERRLWEPKTPPSDPSIQSCRHALEAADLAPSKIPSAVTILNPPLRAESMTSLACPTTVSFTMSPTRAWAFLTACFKRLT